MKVRLVSSLFAVLVGGLLPALCPAQTEGATANTAAGAEPRASREEKPRVRVYSVPIVGLSFLDDEKTFIAVRQDSTVEEWAVDTHERTRVYPPFRPAEHGITFPLHVGQPMEMLSRVGAAAFTPDRELVVCLLNGAHACLSRKSGQWTLLDDRSVVAAGPRSLTIAADSERCAISYKGTGLVLFWNLREGKVSQDAAVDVLDAHIALSPTGALCFTFGQVEGDRVWHVEKKLELTRLVGDGEAIRSAVWLTDGQLITVGEDGGMFLWNIAQPGAPRRLTGGHLDSPTIMACSSRLGMLACGSVGADLVELWDVNEGVLKQSVDLNCHGVTALAFSTSGQLLGIGGHDGAVRILEVSPKGSVLRSK